MLDEVSGNGGPSYLAFDATGAAHVLYFDDLDSSLQHASDESGEWVSEAVALGWAAREYSLVVEPNGTLHAAHGGDLGLLYSWSLPSEGGERAWSTETAFAYATYGNKLASDGDTLHLVFRDAGGDLPESALWHLERTDGVWSTEEAISDGGNFPSLAVDRTGQPLVTYFDDGNRYYAARNGLEWNVELVGESDPLNGLITTDVRGSVHIFYANAGGLQHAVRDHGRWTIEAVSAQEGVLSNGPEGVAIDDDGVIHISHAGGHTSNAGGRWSTQIVDVLGSPGSAVALSPFGEAFISYVRWPSNPYGVPGAIVLAGPGVANGVDDDCDGIIF